MGSCAPASDSSPESAWGARALGADIAAGFPCTRDLAWSARAARMRPEAQLRSETLRCGALRHRGWKAEGRLDAEAELACEALNFAAARVWVGENAL